MYSTLYGLKMNLGGALRNSVRLCFTCLNALDNASGFLRAFDRTCHLTASTIRPDIYVSDEIPAVVFMESLSDNDATKGEEEREAEGKAKKEAERLSQMSGSQYYRSKEYIFGTSSSRMEKWGRFAVVGVGRRLLDLFESPGLKYATLVISVGLLISSIVLFPPLPAIIALCPVLFAAGVDFYISYGGYTSKRRDRNHLATLYLVDSLLAEDKSQEESEPTIPVHADSSESIIRQRKIMAAYAKDLRGVDLEKAKEKTSENRSKVISKFKMELTVPPVNCIAFALGLVLCSTPISVFGIIAFTLGVLSYIYIYSKYKAASTNEYLHQQVTETVEERISQKLETLLGTDESGDEPTLTQEQKEALAILHNLYDIAPEKSKNPWPPARSRYHEKG